MSSTGSSPAGSRSTGSRTPGAPGVRARRSLGVALIGLAALLGACSGSTSTEQAITSDGFVVEPVDEVGPDAFTPSFAEEATICDKAAFVKDLQARPDALQAWAGVLGLAVADVPA